ncbi:MAG: NUDIX hydrolase, partial [Geminicoccaceae bacterium]
MPRREAGARRAPILTREELRYRLAQGAAGRVIQGRGARWLHGDEGVGFNANEPRPAAVLVGVVARPDGPAVLLTERTHHLKDHAGQVSFPGGRVEPHDPSIAAAALREAEEEIGLDRAKVDLLGELAPYDTITGFRIHPVVGWIEPPFEPIPDRHEVEDVFEVPL